MLINEGLTLTPNPPMETENQELRPCIHDGLRRLWQSQALADYTLVAEGRSFRVHKAVLASVSEYFFAMLTSGLKETQQDYAELKAINASTLQLLLEFVYTGILHITEENVIVLLNAADHLQISTAIKACLSFIDAKISVDNCVDILDIAILLGPSDRDFSKIEDFVAGHFSLLIESGNYLKLSFDTFKRLLCREDLMFGPEEKLYQAVMRWVEHDAEVRMKFHNCLMQDIRFPLMTATQVDTIIKTRSEIMCDPVLNKNLKQAQDYLSKPVHQRVLCKNIHTRLRMKPCLLAIEQDHARDEGWVALYTNKGKWHNVKNDFQENCSGACIIINDFLLFCGGTLESANFACSGNCYIFDPREYKWTQLASMCVARQESSLVEHKGFLYAVGGINMTEMSAIRTIERYSFDTNKWEIFTEMCPEWTWSNRNATCVINDGIYHSNGEPEEYDYHWDPSPRPFFDIPTKTWKMAPKKDWGKAVFPVWSQGDLIYSLDDVAYQAFPKIHWYDPRTGDGGLVVCPERVPTMATIVVDNEKLYFVRGSMNVLQEDSEDWTYDTCTEVVIKDKSVLSVNNLDPFPKRRPDDHYCVKLRLPWDQLIFDEDE